jgi:hypothetical protein
MDISCISIFVGFYLVLLPNLTVKALLEYDLAIASSVAILMELVSLLFTIKSSTFEFFFIAGAIHDEMPCFRSKQLPQGC